VSRVGRAVELLPLFWRHYRRELASKENRSRLRLPLTLLRNPEAEFDFTLDILLSHYRQAHPDICFLQVGAFDGVSADPNYPLIEKHGFGSSPGRAVRSGCRRSPAWTGTSTRISPAWCPGWNPWSRSNRCRA